MMNEINIKDKKLKIYIPIILTCITVIIGGLHFVYDHLLAEKPDLAIQVYAGHYEYPKQFTKRLGFLDEYRFGFNEEQRIKNLLPEEGTFATEDQINFVRDFLNYKNQEVYAEPFKKGLSGINSFVLFRIKNVGNDEAKNLFIKGFPTKGIIELRKDWNNTLIEPVKNSLFEYGGSVPQDDEIEIVFFFKEHYSDLDLTNLIVGHDGKSVKFALDQHVKPSQVFMARYGLPLTIVLVMLLLFCTYHIVKLRSGC